MSYYNSTPSKGVVIGWLIASAFVLAIILGLGYMWGWHVYVLRNLFITPTGQGLLIILGIVAVTLALLAFFTFKIESNLACIAVIALGALSILAIVIWGGVTTVNASQKHYLDAGNVEFVEDQALNAYELRVPLEIASAQVASNMGKFEGASYPTRSLPAEGNVGDWNSLVAARGFAVGYEGVVSIDSPTFGDVKPAEVDRCEFDSSKANLRLGGMLPGNDLKRVILSKVYWSNVTLINDDLYGYCNDAGEPVVVAPLVEMQGSFWNKIDVPWGLAIYNGITGDLELTQDAKIIAEIPGATYPLSVASNQRLALQSYDGGWWEHVQGRLGWDVVGNSELKLRTSETETEYFTALQPRGASESVTAIFTTPGTMITPGKLAPVQVNLLNEERASDSKISDTIFNKYSYMPEFAGLKYNIYEIAPAETGSWVASIGSSQSVVYRALITKNGEEVTLINSAGESLKGTVTVDEITGEANVAVEGSIEGLTEAELLQLLGQISDRLKELNTQ